MTAQPPLRDLLAKALTEWGDTASWYVFADKDVDELLATPSGIALASRETALERALPTVERLAAALHETADRSHQSGDLFLSVCRQRATTILAALDDNP